MAGFFPITQKSDILTGTKATFEVLLMKVTLLTIEYFRGINKGSFYFDGHALLIGMNNVGKSTICEALDLVLGPDRLSKLSPVEEFDFYNAEYLQEDGETVIPARMRWS